MPISHGGAATASASPAAAASGYGPIRVRQAGHHPVTDNTERHRRWSGKTWAEQAGQVVRSGCQAAVSPQR